MYVDWGNRIIQVLKTDLTLVQSTPTEIYNMDLNWFHLTLKDLEDEIDGMPFPNTHNHNTEVSLGGLTYARVIEIINNYTVTFEDGQYAVNLIGANSNVGDKVNVNQVSVRSNNSAGMISSPEIQYASFNGRVTIDVDNGSSGTAYPIGTPLYPVNNLDDALFIANYRGFDTIFLLSDLTIATGTNIDNFNIVSENWYIVTVETGVSQIKTTYKRVSLYGELGAYWNILIDCWVYDITEFSGWMRGGSFESITLSEYVAQGGDYGGINYFDDVVPMYPDITATLISNTNVQISFTNCMEIVTIESLTAGSVVVMGLREGKLIIDSTCTGGTIKINGFGTFENNSLLSLNTEGLINQDVISQAVWDELIASHLSAGTTGEALSDAGGAGNPWSSPVSGNTDPGTMGEHMAKKLLTTTKWLGLK